MVGAQTLGGGFARRERVSSRSVGQVPRAPDTVPRGEGAPPRPGAVLYTGGDRGTERPRSVAWVTQPVLRLEQLPEDSGWCKEREARPWEEGRAGYGRLFGTTAGGPLQPKQDLFVENSWERHLEGWKPAFVWFACRALGLGCGVFQWRFCWGGTGLLPIGVGYRWGLGTQRRFWGPLEGGPQVVRRGFCRSLSSETRDPCTENQTFLPRSRLNRSKCTSHSVAVTCENCAV